MKTLKFRSELVEQILNGTKTVTWRLFDDKDLKVDDTFEIINASTGENNGEAIIVEIQEKRLDEITDVDYNYSRYAKETQNAMLKHYKDIYGDKVNLNSVVKIIKFKLTDD